MKNSKDNYKKDLEEIDKRMEEIDKLVKEADEFENVDFESFEYRTEKENAIYEKTKEFGRTQFVREISFQISENKKLRDRELIITMELDKLQKENKQLRLILGNQVRIKDELSKKRDIAMGILKTWNDFCKVKQKYCIDKDKEHWNYCIEKLEVLEEVLKGSDIDE